MSHFHCQRCCACCKQPGFVYLKGEDAERLASRLGMDVYRFTETYCLFIDRRHLALTKHPDEVCIFLEPSGCGVYEARPQQCRDFPKNWKTERSLEYCKGLKRPV